MYFAAGPDISISPSWNPTILPHVITADPTNACVLPLPTCLTLLIVPGNIPPLPETLTLGSITSFTGAMRIDSPGLAKSTLTDMSLSSSSTSFIISSLLT